MKYLLVERAERMREKREEVGLSLLKLKTGVDIRATSITAKKMPLGPKIYYHNMHKIQKIE